MADPLRYFYDAKQRELADQIWTIAATKTTFYTTVCSMNRYWFNSSDARRLLHAKD